MLLHSTSLQKVAGQRLRRLLELLTSNRIVKASVGALVTAVIQSSSITSVMVTRFVNAGFLRLQQAIGVKIGANIGRAITGQIIAFKIDLYGLPLIRNRSGYHYACQTPPAQVELHARLRGHIHCSMCLVLRT